MLEASSTRSFETMLRTLLLATLCLSACSTTPQFIRDPTNTGPFSNGVLVGNTFYVAGHLGRVKATSLPPADAAAETELMLDSFAATLAKVDMTMDNLVQVQLFCSDVGLYKTFNDVYRKRFKKNFPARAFIGSGGLLFGCRFEITGIAAR